MVRRSSLFDKSRAAVGLVAGVLLFAGPSQLWNGLVDAAGPTPRCSQSGKITHCVCEKAAQDSEVTRVTEAVTPTVSLSEESNGITIQCDPAKFTFVPSTETDVCVWKDSQNTLAVCNQDTTKTSIKTFLNLDTDDLPKWTTSSNDGRHSLLFSEHALPLTEKRFYAGCISTGSGERTQQEECLVTVSVKARTSSVKDGVLTCAYGAESNKSVPEVRLNSANNSLTIVCGNEGTMQPTKESLTAYQCSGAENEGCKTVKLTEVMPRFTSSWWAEDEKNKNAPKLVIPEGGFPDQEETILLGCKQNSQTAAKEAESGTTPAVELPKCKVKVTLSAHSSASQASNVSFLGLLGLALTPLVFLGTY
ncbi:SAG-related sequence SRS36B [Toxoplasma gondii RUB]|uniref:SAG-related sequence SRS36B n=1 Tax=Toxoplasma gondii RUB TaxID=935652 RepID=A0A086M204_TOXGO|nr:SAG-related sequence SRS36B [Toxoplasma gondii RUB]